MEYALKGQFGRNEVEISVQNCPPVRRRENRQIHQKPYKRKENPKFGQNCTISKQKKVRKTPDQRRLTKLASKRIAAVEKAVRFAYGHQVNLQLNAFVTITWDCLFEAGDLSGNHIVGLTPKKRDDCVRRRIRDLLTRHGFVCAYIWASDVGRRFGRHIHFLMHLPESMNRPFIALLESLTGSEAAYINRPYDFEIGAQSSCSGWQLKWIISHDKLANAIKIATYIARQPIKHPGYVPIEGPSYGVSRTIGRSAQKERASTVEVQRVDEGLDAVPTHKTG